MKLLEVIDRFMTCCDGFIVKQSSLNSRYIYIYKYMQLFVCQSYLNKIFFQILNFAGNLNGGGVTFPFSLLFNDYRWVALMLLSNLKMGILF